MAIQISSLSAQQGGPSQRTALVIGNANYPDADRPLTVAVRDARAIAEELRRSGFEVDIKENVTKEAMRSAIDAFTNKIRPDAAALIYFSGFGIQVSRQTYLLPVNAQIWSESDVARDGTSIEAVLSDMHRRGARIKIVILDASYRNPFERRFRRTSMGLATIESPSGTLAISSTAPNKIINEVTTENSLFTSELIKEIRSPNLAAEEVFNHARLGVALTSKNEQVPWVGSTLVEDFSFGRPSRASGSPSIAAPTPAPRPQSPAQTSRPLPPLPAPSAPNPAPSAPAASLPSGARAGEIIRDCGDCGDLVVMPAGDFDMGSNENDFEKPIRRVTISKRFAIGRYEVTFREWDLCVSAGACTYRPDDRGWGRGDRPVIDVSWNDAKTYAAWLTQKTGQKYRLPSEAEWEYAARGAKNSTFWWGDRVEQNRANCRDCGTGGSAQSLPVGSYQANPLGLFDTAGNVAEWVEDCWNDNYRNAPSNAAPRTSGQCQQRVLRGGSFASQSTYLRSAARFRYDVDVRYYANGFRLVREIE